MPLRPLVAGAAVFLALLLAARFDTDVGLALPLMVMLSVLVAVGAARLLATGPRLARWLVPALAAAAVASSLACYPWFSGYLTEFVQHRETRGYQVLANGNLDRGQGLLALRDWMRRHHVRRVYLSTFDAAPPTAYGIDYVPLQSDPPLPAPPAAAPGSRPPLWLVVSAANMNGAHLRGDPFRFLHHAQPDYVIAGCLYVYRVMSFSRASHPSS